MTNPFSAAAINSWLQHTAALLACCLVGCSAEDPLVTVACASAPSDAISVRAHPLDRPVSGAGALVNLRQLSPGMLIAVTPAPIHEAELGDRGSAKIAYSLPLSSRDFLPPRPEYWELPLAGANFRIQFPKEVDGRLTPGHKREVTRRLVTNSAIVTWYAEQRVLRDSLRLLNADQHVADLLRSAPSSTRFIFLSGGVYSNSAAVLMYFWGGMPANIMTIDNFYLHLRYECPSLEHLDRATRASPSGVPVVLYYVGVRFDEYRRVVMLDQPSIDLTLFDFPSPDP